MMHLEFTEAGRGVPLVLLHAFPLDRRMWEPQWSALGEGVRVIAVDLPGFGATAPEPGWSIDFAADRLAKTLDQLNLTKAAIGGLSMGGYVAMAFARRHPERLSHLLLADTRSEADDSTGKDNRNRLIKLTEEFGPSKVYEVMLPKVLCEATHQSKPQIVEFVRSIAALQSGPGVIGGLQALRDRPDATPDLEKIKVPTAILVGESDSLTPPKMSESMAERIPGSKLVRIPDAGHLSNVENPTAFNAAVRELLGV